MISIEGDTVEVSQPDGQVRKMELGSAEAFQLLSQVWLRAGWDTKHVYTFTWLGRPIIQLPEDMFRLQEVICAVKPTVIVETGVAHGGGLVFYAGLLQNLGGGRVIGVDVEIRDHNRRAIEDHPLADSIQLIEGSSVSSEVFDQVSALIGPEDRVLVTLDSNHSKQHVLRELELYSPLVSVGSYIVAMDGIMGEVCGAPRSEADWRWNNPTQAARDFVSRAPEQFVVEQPGFLFNESVLSQAITYWPGGYVRRIA